MPNIIDQLLSDFSPSAEDSAVAAGISRGQDIKAISDAEDQGLLDELAPGGQHTNVTSGIVAAQEDWHESAAKPFTAEDSVMGDVLKQAGEVEGDTFQEDACGKQAMSNTEVKSRISSLLHLGQSPRQVTAHLNKLAELTNFNREVAAEFLNDQAGLSGMAYLEPNHFNKSCVASMRHIKQNGTLRAASVKRIKACDGCSNCKDNHSGGCKCATYGLPIVATAKDLERVIESITPGKKAKKAALVARHNGDHGQALPGHTVVATQQASPRDTKLTKAGVGEVKIFDAQAHREAATAFGPKAVRASLESGKSLEQVYREAKKAYGSDKAERVLRGYLDGLKKSACRINVAAVDCSLLRHRLTASETLIGKPECASCGYRTAGMHCGLTGGTLLDYPGMAPANRKNASAALAAPDGVEIMSQLGLHAPEMTIDIKGDPDLLPVEMPSVETTQW